MLGSRFQQNRRQNVDNLDRKNKSVEQRDRLEVDSLPVVVPDDQSDQKKEGHPGNQQVIHRQHQKVHENNRMLFCLLATRV